jgi:hypothetical protein
MPEVWVPGAAGPLDQFVTALHRRVQEFGEREGIERPSVEFELYDGALISVESVSADPGYGFLTIRPHPESQDEPEELIVPLGSIRQITLGRPEPARARFGFSLPDP